MKVLSLFDGVSCARVAFDRAGIPIDNYFASEVDKYAIQIAKKNYPDTVCVGDVKGVSYGSQLYWKTENGSLNGYHTKIDILIGGSPCQDLSIAKKDRKGLEGSKSSLFREYVRILREVKPKRFILENVASMPQKDRDIITKEMGVEPIMINAALVSAQTRKRLFRTNIPGITQPEDKGILLKDILEKDVDEKYNISPDTKTKWIEKGLSKDGKAKAISASLHKGIGTDGLTLVRIGQIGNGGQGDRIYSTEGKSVGLSALGGGRGAKTGLYVTKIGNSKKFGNPKRECNKSYTLTSGRLSVGIEEDNVIRKLTPIECERLQCLPDNYTEGVSNSQRYKMLGNAFNVDIVAHILSFIP